MSCFVFKLLLRQIILLLSIHQQQFMFEARYVKIFEEIQLDTSVDHHATQSTLQIQYIVIGVDRRDVDECNGYNQTQMNSYMIHTQMNGKWSYHDSLQNTRSIKQCPGIKLQLQDRSSSASGPGYIARGGY